MLQCKPSIVKKIGINCFFSFCLCTNVFATDLLENHNTISDSVTDTNQVIIPEELPTNTPRVDARATREALRLKNIESAWSINTILTTQLILMQKATLQQLLSADELKNGLELIRNHTEGAFKDALKRKAIRNSDQLAHHLFLQSNYPAAYLASLFDENASHAEQVLNDWIIVDENFALLLNQSLPLLDYHTIHEAFNHQRLAYMDLINELKHSKSSIAPKELMTIYQQGQVIAGLITTHCVK